jgi:hypothetical protein
MRNMSRHIRHLERPALSKQHENKQYRLGRGLTTQALNVIYIRLQHDFDQRQVSCSNIMIGSSLIVLAGIPPKWHDIPVIGLAEFVIAGVMGFWLLISILRRGRM